MGKSAKLTRGGNKTRVNEGRQDAKLRAMGLTDPRRSHAAGGACEKKGTAEEAQAARLAATKHSIAARLRMLQQQEAQPAAKMLAKPAAAGKAQPVDATAAVPAERKATAPKSATLEE